MISFPRALRFHNIHFNRISTLEMLDEVEELELVLEHYAVSWGLLFSASNSNASDWKKWGLQKKEPLVDNPEG
jgi:[phosphatase 2A protein]-leucine-carboxy methyltransferase